MFLQDYERWKCTVGFVLPSFRCLQCRHLSCSRCGETPGCLEQRFPPGGCLRLLYIFSSGCWGCSDYLPHLVDCRKLGVSPPWVLKRTTRCKSPEVSRFQLDGGGCHCSPGRLCQQRGWASIPEVQSHRDHNAAGCTDRHRQSRAFLLQLPAPSNGDLI